MTSRLEAQKECSLNLQAHLLPVEDTAKSAENIEMSILADAFVRGKHLRAAHEIRSLLLAVMMLGPSPRQAEVDAAKAAERTKQRIVPECLHS